jgi:hypothetical protein
MAKNLPRNCRTGKRHFDVVKALLDVQNQNPAYTRLKIHFNQLEELLQGVLTLRELTPKTRDQILKLRRTLLGHYGKQNCRPAF